MDGNDLALVELLLEYGAGPNAQGRKGRTPISRAEQMGNAAIAEALKNPPAKRQGGER